MLACRAGGAACKKRARSELTSFGGLTVNFHQTSHHCFSSQVSTPVVLASPRLLFLRLFVDYHSILSFFAQIAMSFIPYPSISVSIKPGFIETFPPCSWIVTHKYHGTNFMIRIGQDGSVRFGRRNGYLSEGQRHYNHEEAVRILFADFQVSGFLFAYASLCRLKD
jgi:hypothetical protein